MKANKCQHALFKIQQRYYEYGLQVVHCRILFSYILDVMKLFFELELDLLPKAHGAVRTPQTPMAGV